MTFLLRASGGAAAGEKAKAAGKDTMKMAANAIEKAEFTIIRLSSTIFFVSRSVRRLRQVVVCGRKEADCIAYTHIYILASASLARPCFNS